MDRASASAARQISEALVARTLERSQGLAFQLAVCHITRVGPRVMMALWSFADRWGTVTPDGVAINVRLTHELLARVVGARRPTVSTALRRLEEEGLIRRRPNGTLLLCGEPPRGYSRLRGDTAG